MSRVVAVALRIGSRHALTAVLASRAEVLAVASPVERQDRDTKAADA